MDETVWVVANEVIRWGTLVILAALVVRLLAHKQRIDGLEAKVSDNRHALDVLKDDVRLLRDRTYTQDVRIVNPAQDPVQVSGERAAVSTPTDCGT